MRATNTILRIVAAFCLVATTPGCLRDELVPNKQMSLAFLHYVDVDAHFCVPQPVQVRQKIKYVFILDRSSSNQPGFPSTFVTDNGFTITDESNTDSVGGRRFGPLAQFIKSLQPDPNNLTSFNLINFSDSACYPLPGKPCANSGGMFESDPVKFMQTVRSEWIGPTGSATSPVPYDKGFTNYTAALGLARQLIDNDARLEAGNPIKPIVRSIYQIIFVSDGQPVVDTGGVKPHLQDFTTEVLPMINLILDEKNDPLLAAYIANITLSTAYYFNGTPDAAAQGTLQQIADAGTGQYMEFGPGQNVVYQAFAPPIRYIRYNLAETWLQNVNAVWWDDGRLLPDTDGDGLPDELEFKFGSDIRKTDSDGNGISDLVEYRTKGRPCNGAACDPTKRDLYSICDGFGPTKNPDGSQKFPDLDRDGLNECEEFILKSDRYGFDSNSDFLPDGLAFKLGMPFIAGTQGLFAAPMGDGLTNYDKIKKGLPTSIALNKVLNFKTRVNSLYREPDPKDPDVDCYNAKFNRVAALGPDNSLKMYLILNSTLVEDNPVLEIAERKLDGYANQITFDQGAFQ